MNLPVLLFGRVGMISFLHLGLICARWAQSVGFTASGQDNPAAPRSCLIARFVLSSQDVTDVVGRRDGQFHQLSDLCGLGVSGVHNGFPR